MLDEGVQSLQGGARVDGSGGHGNTVLQILGGSPHYEGCGGVHQHDVAARATLTTEDLADDPRVFRAIAAPEVLNARAWEPEVLGADRRRPDHAFVYLRDAAWPRVGDLVETVRPVHHEGAERAQFGEHARQGLREGFRVHADDLGIGARGIGERAEHVEDGANAHLAPRRHDVLHGGVEERRVEEADAHLLDAAGNLDGAQLDDDAKRLDHVGRAAQGGQRAVPVLGDLEPRSRDHEGGGGRHVEGARSIAARARGIDQHLAIGARGAHHLVGPRLDPDHLLAHHLPEPDQLLDGLALHAKGGEEGGDLHVGGGAGHDRLHGARRLDAREIPALGERAHRLRDDGAGHGRVRSPASRGRMAEAASSTSPMLMGLASTECTPLASSSSWETSTAKPLTRITGRPGATVRTERASSHPVMPGMERSVNTRSSRSLCTWASPSEALRATVTVCPAERRTSASMSPTFSSSSTTRQRSGTASGTSSASGTGASGAALTGKSMMKVVPCPSWLSTAMVAPWRERMP